MVLLVTNVARRAPIVKDLRMATALRTLPQQFRDLVTHTPVQSFGTTRKVPRKEPSANFFSVLEIFSFLFSHFLVKKLPEFVSGEKFPVHSFDHANIVH